MSTPQIIESGTRLGGVAPEAIKSEFRSLTDLAGDRHFGAVLRITAALQTTLDIHALVRLFGEELALLVPFDSLRYRHPLHELSIEIGKPGRHSCNYRLTVQNDTLGELKITRRRKFAADEAAQIENAVCALIYPLRNAITYLTALKAAQQDPLTGTSNRAAFDNSLMREVELARRHSTPLSMIVVDIDLFKSINDTYGHAIGDEVIRNLTATIGKVIRKATCCSVLAAKSSWCC